jgi:HEAT repeat protein
VRRSLQQGWTLPAGLEESLPRMIHEWANDPNLDERTRMRAAEALKSMREKNLDHLIELAKQVRLDTPGEATEKQKIEVVYVDRIDTNRD